MIVYKNYFNLITSISFVPAVLNVNSNDWPTLNGRTSLLSFPIHPVPFAQESVITLNI